MQETYTEFKGNSAAFKMIYVEGGVFEMGSNAKEAYYDEKPIHKVQVSSFWMGEFAVTQALWAYVMAGIDKENPSYFKGVNRPVENVSWEGIVQDFLPRLNNMTGRDYCLPTEGEWEYAARGGKYGQQYPFTYGGSNKLEEVGWYGDNSHGETKRVGLKTPNLLGFYDVSGNLWEWSSDRYGPYEGSNKSATVSYLVYRGGSWNSYIHSCRPTGRPYSAINFYSNFIGLRLARPISISRDFS